MGTNLARRPAVASGSRQRLTVAEAAEKLAECERGEGVVYLRPSDFNSPFPTLTGKIKLSAAVAKWKSRLYNAIQRREIEHERDPSYERSVVHLRWPDVCRWYRSKWKTVEAINGSF